MVLFRMGRRDLGEPGIVIISWATGRVREVLSKKQIIDVRAPRKTYCALHCRPAMLAVLLVQLRFSANT
ncbi:MAG: hypothetical protein ACREWI_04405, partial [Telluria sp.]